MSACSPLLMQMSAAGPLVPAAPSTFVDARARFEGVLELRPGRNIECSFRPHEKDAKAPTIFLVPRGGSTAEEEFGAPFVAELAKTATVATMACDADADEAARDLYEFFKRYAGQDKRAKFQTSKPHISAVFHSFWLIFGRAIISWNGLEA